MKVHIGVDKNNGLIHSIEMTAVNVHDLTTAAEFLHGRSLSSTTIQIIRGSRKKKT
jgi:hypothetical protein